jgi:DNA-binding IscR family transcriptional regulator
MLHVLIHMDRHVKRPTSEQLSKMLGTNPVVVRRMMAGLRDKALVRSGKGHGGGWELIAPLSQISLLDVYEAIGHPQLFNIGPQAEFSPCLVEQAVDARINATLAAAEQAVLEQFGTITVEDVARDFEAKGGHWPASEAPSCGSEQAE